MSLDKNGNLKEEQSSSGRPYLAIEKEVNGRRSIFVDQDGNTYHLDAKIKKSFSGSVTQTFNFDGDMKGVCLSNDGAAPLTLVINEIQIQILTGEVFEGRFDTFSSLQVKGSSSFRGYVTD